MDALEQGRRKNPYFDLASFGSRFQDPALQRRIEESLRKAGLELSEAGYWLGVFLEGLPVGRRP